LEKEAAVTPSPPPNLSLRLFGNAADLFPHAFKSPENCHAREASVHALRFARTRGKIVSLKRGEARPNGRASLFPAPSGPTPAEKEEAPTGGRGFFGSFWGEQ
jgi:hypothetical protein